MIKSVNTALCTLVFLLGIMNLPLDGSAQVNKSKSDSRKTVQSTATVVSPTNRAESRAALIPYPRQVGWSQGKFDLSRYAVKLPEDDTAELRFVGDELHGVIQQAGGRLASNTAGVKSIVLKYGSVEGAVENKEGYQLVITSKQVILTAPETAGLYYGVQTLRQLIQENEGRPFFPCCTIKDRPAFECRGFMHDVGRNFQDVELLKKFFDVMGRYKMNIFHMHLTDRPGYRIECRKYPQLNDAKNYRQTRQPGKFYRYDELNDIIAYCRMRHIRVIPEIDMPGHSEYFKNTFGFDMQDPKGIEILSDILNEFFDNVDLPLFHMGSDEVRVGNKEFMPTIAKLIRDRGKKLLVWRPGHLPDEKVITQLWGRGSRPIAGVPYLDSRANYVNHMDALVGPVRVFFQQPCRVKEGNEVALGGILCHWPDNSINEQMDIYRQSPVFPALLAYAERYWRGSENNRNDAWAKLPVVDDEAFKEFAEFEHDLIIHRDRYFKDWPFPYVKQTDFHWRLIGPFDHKGDTRASFAVENKIQPSYTVDGKSHAWKEAQAIGGTIHINHFFGFPGYLPKVQSGTAYALTYIHSPRKQKVDFWIGFNGYSRSGGRHGGPNPQQGQWSSANSKVWINDKEISPPKWALPGMGRNSKEKPFIDEDYFYRPPTRVPLKKGWNKVLVKAPKGGSAWKWMFTCVPISWDGNMAREVKGLQFSTKPDMK